MESNTTANIAAVLASNGLRVGIIDTDIHASGGLPDGSTFQGVDGLEAALLRRPELFATALTEKLLTFALGRGVRPEDAPAIRRIVRDAQADQYRFSRLVTGIARSVPFTQRKSP